MSVILVPPNGTKKDDFEANFWEKGLVLCDKGRNHSVMERRTLSAQHIEGCGVP